eukprot:5454966-Prymnesium_polylepis.2
MALYLIDLLAVGRAGGHTTGRAIDRVRVGLAVGAAVRSAVEHLQVLRADRHAHAHARHDAREVLLGRVDGVVTVARAALALGRVLLEARLARGTVRRGMRDEGSRMLYLQASQGEGGGYVSGCEGKGSGAVSYTHLTLPTICSV